MLEGLQMEGVLLKNPLDLIYAANPLLLIQVGTYPLVQPITVPD